MVIAIDLDGTIVEHKWPEIGELRMNAKEVINRLYNEGHTIIIWTCRGNLPPFHGKYSTLDAALQFLDDNGIKYHSANKNTPSCPFMSEIKVYADVYIDDKALDPIPEDWETIYKMINDRKEEYYEKTMKS